MKPWEMILVHRYAEAAACYEAELKHHPTDPSFLSAHATAMLGLGRLTESLDGFRRANVIASQELNGETQPYLEDIGTILWLLGNKGEAIQTFRAAVDGVANGSIKFTDHAGGVSQGLLLWYAGVTVANDEVKCHALKYLRRLSKRSRIKYWPGALAFFVLGKKTLADVLVELCGTSELQESINQAKDDLLKRRHLVQALFYFATLKRDEHDEELCRAGMVQCASLENPVLELEWYLAHAETEQLSRYMV